MKQIFQSNVESLFIDKASIIGYKNLNGAQELCMAHTVWALPWYIIE